MKGEYSVDLVPDPRFGLGLRLEEIGNQQNHSNSSGGGGGGIIATSFKRTPGTDAILPAERTGQVVLGDQLLRVNGRDLTVGNMSL